MCVCVCVCVRACVRCVTAAWPACLLAASLALASLFVILAWQTEVHVALALRVERNAASQYDENLRKYLEQQQRA